MAYITVNEFVGGTKDQYEAAVAALFPPDGPPSGQTRHYAGPSSNGWVVIAVWDSKELWEAFRDDTLIPGLKDPSPGGVEKPVPLIQFEVDVEIEVGD